MAAGSKFLLLATAAALLVSCGLRGVAAREDTARYCNKELNYCLIYPSSFFEKKKELPEENGLLLSSSEEQVEMKATAFRNTVYYNLEQWYNEKIREVESKHERVNEIEGEYTDNFLFMHLILDGVPHRYKVYRFDTLWVVLHLKASLDANREKMEALWEEIIVTRNI